MLDSTMETTIKQLWKCSTSIKDMLYFYTAVIYPVLECKGKGKSEHF